MEAWEAQGHSAKEQKIMKASSRFARDLNFKEKQLLVLELVLVADYYYY